MDIAFYVASAIAIISTIMVVTQLNAVHALLYLIVSLLAVAVVFFTLGAPFVAALEVIVYAGAIMVLFVFVVMMLNIGPQTIEEESRWLRPRTWVGPSILSVILIVELFYVFAGASGRTALTATPVDPKQVGLALFGPYLLGVELASMLLLAGLVGAYHLGRRTKFVMPKSADVPQLTKDDGHERETTIPEERVPPPETPRIRVR